MESKSMNYYMMTYEEYEALAPLEKLKLWIEIDASLIKQFLEYYYKLKKINQLKEQTNDTSN